MYISNRTIIGCVTGVIYEMHPYHQPDNLNIIVDEFEKYFDNIDNGRGKNDKFKLLDFKDWKEFNKWLKEFLMNIKEFRQLNISKKLKDAGVQDIDDDRNKGIKIVDRHTIETKDSRYSDFIDLDACIQNICIQIQILKEYDEDCFLCNYAKEYGSMEPGDHAACKSCVCNPNIRFNRIPHPMSLKPHNQWTEEEKEKYEL